MTEDEVNDLAKRVEGETDIDLEAETVWTQNELTNALSVERGQILAFRLHKRLRNDEAMTNLGKAVENTRGIIKYCKERLEQLSAK